MTERKRGASKGSDEGLTPLKGEKELGMGQRSIIGSASLGRSQPG